MHDGFTEEKIKQLLDGLEKYAAQVKSSAHGKAVHLLRVNYKKLRAFTRMLGVIEDVRMPGALKVLYKAAGAVRDKELYLQSLVEYCSRNNCNMPVYMDVLADDMGKAQEHLQVVAKQVNMDSARKELLRSIPGKLKVEDITGFVEHERKVVEKLTGNNHSDEELHSVRKHLKDALYCLKTVKEEQIYRPKDYKKLQQTLGTAAEMLGLHQDASTQGTIAQQDIVGLPPDERVILEQIQQQWLDKKKGLRNRLEKLPYDADVKH